MAEEYVVALFPCLLSDPIEDTEYIVRPRYLASGLHTGRRWREGLKEARIFTFEEAMKMAGSAAGMWTINKLEDTRAEGLTIWRFSGISSTLAVMPLTYALMMSFTYVEVSS